MRLPRFAIDNYQFTITIVVLLIAMGIVSYRTMPRSEDPQFAIPGASVIVIYPGASTIDLEHLIVDPIEEEVNKLAERIALVPLEFLALHKAWVNRALETMGVRSVINAGIEANAISRFTKPHQDFLRLAEEKGLKAALSEHLAPFKKSPNPLEEK